jgi:predicted nuclease with TOPRIM domain
MTVREIEQLRQRNAWLEGEVQRLGNIINDLADRVAELERAS